MLKRGQTNITLRISLLFLKPWNQILLFIKQGRHPYFCVASFFASCESQIYALSFIKRIFICPILGCNEYKSQNLAYQIRFSSFCSSTLVERVHRQGVTKNGALTPLIPGNGSNSEETYSLLCSYAHQGAYFSLGCEEKKNVSKPPFWTKWKFAHC